MEFNVRNFVAASSNIEIVTDVGFEFGNIFSMQSIIGTVSDLGSDVEN